MKIFTLLTLVLIASLACALPDTATQRTGDLCEMRHSFKYTYTFSYSKTMVLGEDTPLNITFTISGTEVARSPRTIGVEVASEGFEISEKNFSLSGDRKTIVIRPLTNNPSLSLKTTLTVDGDEPRHRGYTATYMDTFNLRDFEVASPESTLLGSSSTAAVTDTTTVEAVVEQSEPSPASWYIVRAAGLIAYVLLSFSVAIGLLRRISPQRTSLLFRRHCDVSYLALVFAVLHILNTLVDKYIWNLKLSEVLLPFDFSSETHTMLSLGVAAFYLMSAVTLSSASPKIIAALKRRRWYFLHLTTYCMYVFVVVHSFVIGSDLGASRLDDLPSTLIYGFFWLLAIANGVLFAIVLGIRRGRR